MRTLSTPVSDEAAAEQSGWTEVYDFYLRQTLTGQFGTYSILRLTVHPFGLWFFAPQVAPEPEASRGDAYFYRTWPFKREQIKAASRFTNDKIAIHASNVTAAWSEALAQMEWRDTPVVIRKVPLIDNWTADDCVVIFSGQIDSATISLAEISFTCSNDLANLSTIAPRENMHTNCRFNWGDDLCTAIRFLAENYKAKTVGNGSTTTLVKSTGLTEDTATNPTGAQYTALAVTCDASTEKLTATAHGLENGQLIQFVGTAPAPCSTIAYYYVVNKTANDFQISLTPGGSAINLTSSPSTYVRSFRSYGTDLVNPLSDGAITTSSENAGLVDVVVGVIPLTDQISDTDHGLKEGDAVTFSTTGTMPSPLVAGTVYYAHPTSNHLFKLSATPTGSIIDITTSGSGTLKVSTVGTWQGYNVKSRKDYFWKFGNAADWGTRTQGYWQIPDAQSGLANPALKPYIQFDFGSAKTPRVWRFSAAPGLKLEELPRLLAIFSSDDPTFVNAGQWEFQQYFEMPPRGGTLFDCLIPKAATRRYWRICVRSRWAESLFFSLLNKVFAYEASRHWWASGRIQFDDDTTTVALRGVSRRVLESYSGEVVVPTLPATPANGDTFIIERGCSRTFNPCNERRNWENFGGFLDLPTQTVIR